MHRSKSLETYDFLAIPSLNKKLVVELARCEWIGRRENVGGIAVADAVWFTALHHSLQDGALQELSIDKWSVLIQEHHPGFIDWATFEANQKRLDANTHPPL